MLFNRSGHEALTAADGAAALEILEREKDIDAVVSDVRMPKIDGFQLCRTIRNDSRWAKLPFIFYSSIFIGDPAKTFGRDLGATAYLDAKDIAPGEVAKELGEYLGDRINNPLAVILGSAQLLEMRDHSQAASEAAERIGAAVSKINDVVREIASRSGVALR